MYVAWTTPLQISCFSGSWMKFLFVIADLGDPA